MSKLVILEEQFFNRDAETVAKELLGMYLVRKKGNKEITARIIETEAYIGPEDKASHAHRGKTKRNAPMFGVAGHWYVYLCYGIHEMLNIVTGSVEHPAAVLIRGVEIDGEYTHGPGRVTKQFTVNRKLFNAKKASKETSLWMEDRGEKVSSKEIKKGSRVGVGYAGPKWSKRHLRFFLNS